MASLVTACQRGPCPPDTELRGSPKAGQQSCEYQDSNGTVVKHGPFLEWHANGQKSSEGSYRHGQDGHWVFWDEQGRKVAEREYRGGELVTEKNLVPSMSGRKPWTRFGRSGKQAR